MEQQARNSDAQDLDRWVHAYRTDGCVRIEGALSPPECAELRADIDAAMVEYPGQVGEHERRWLRSLMHQLSPTAVGLIDRAPVVDVAERLLACSPGSGVDVPERERRLCHILNLAALVHQPGYPGQTWHIDADLFMPRPAGVPWDERIPFPVQILTAMYYLTDVDGTGGPTMVIPGSHRSGRLPDPDAEAPTYQDRGPQIVEARTGDCLIFDSQLWHRAGANRSSRTRYVLQIHYGARFIMQRFLPFPNHHVPPAFLAGLNERQQRLMGLQSCLGPYC